MTLITLPRGSMATMPVGSDDGSWTCALWHAFRVLNSEHDIEYRITRDIRERPQEAHGAAPPSPYPRRYVHRMTLAITVGGTVTHIDDCDAATLDGAGFVALLRPALPAGEGDAQP